MAWFRDTALSLEKLKTIHLDPELIAELLYEQKVRALHKYSYYFERRPLHVYVILFLTSEASVSGFDLMYYFLNRFWQWRFCSTGSTLRRW